MATRSEEPYADPSEDLLHMLEVCQANDQATQERIARVANQPDSETSDWQMKGTLLYKNDAIVVPRDAALCSQLLRMHHDDPMAGHFGREKTLDLLARKYFWKEMRKDVEEYVKSCAVCQKRKAKRHRPYGELSALPMPDRAWEQLTMDFITDLPPSRRGECVYDAILVIVDRYSKMSVYIPSTKRCTAVELAQLLLDEVVRHYGVPKGIVSDRGSLFTSAYWSEFCFEAQVKRKLSTAFHPQTDGQTERQNQTLEQYLRCYCSEFQDDWAPLLNMAEFAANNSVHPTLRMSPFSVVYGWNPDIHVSPDEARGEPHGGRVPAAAESVQRMRDTHETLAQRWRESAEQQSKYYNRKHQPRAFSVGDQVLLSTKNLTLSVPKKKMGLRFLGPFRVLDAVGSQAYRLALPTKYRIHNVFHVSLLEPWHPRAGEEPEESMPLAEQEDEWMVEEVLATQVKAGQRYYLLKWKDWPPEYNSWEPEEHCAHARSLLDAFWAQERPAGRQGRPRGAKGRGKAAR